MTQQHPSFEPLRQSLDLPPPGEAGRIVVAMSGGVDSSVVAASLHHMGYEVVGVTLQLYDQKNIPSVRTKTCCAGLDIYDAKRVAEKMGFPHYVLDYESRFSQSVVDHFADSYLRGETPIPCVTCNQTVKFNDLLETARNLGAVALATGHYVRRDRQGEEARLLRAVDDQKDQSYFLFATTQDQLMYLRFPLGGILKEHTRDYAAFFDLDIAEKPDSQDICFVPDGKYANVVAKLRPGALEAGEIKHIDGRTLGTHNGIIHYTVGQRKGLGLASMEPLYVIRLDASRHQVIVGPREALACQEIRLKEVSRLDPAQDHQMKQEETFKVMVKIRSSQSPLPARIKYQEQKRACVILETPEYGVSPGQACVFYRDNQVLGGGWITQDFGEAI